MSSVFETILNVGDKVVDTVFADEEKFDFFPKVRRPVDGKVTADPDRDEKEDVIAIFDDQQMTVLTGSAGSQASNPPPIRSSTTPQIIVMTEYLPQGVRVGDQFTRKKNDKVYQVTNIMPDGLQRYFLDVVIL
ncbi:MAG: hypothetical protein L0287_27650 [Anaerolineae bacterium]|nr:hypothetical protein [Anaerolineae bacterium]